MQRSPHFLIPAEAGNLSVDQTQGVSLYIQVANILRYAILSGAIAPGSRLPTVVELGDHFKVARITIREAIRVLAEEGLLVSSRGRGIHVLQHPSQSKPAPQIADAMDADVSSVEIVILAVDDLTTVPADMLKEAIAFPTCRIPDDYIDENRYPLFMARAVLRELIESLQATGSATPC